MKPIKADTYSKPEEAAINDAVFGVSENTEPKPELVKPCTLECI